MVLAEYQRIAVSIGPRHGTQRLVKMPEAEDKGRALIIPLQQDVQAVQDPRELPAEERLEQVCSSSLTMPLLMPGRRCLQALPARSITLQPLAALCCTCGRFVHMRTFEFAKDASGASTALQGGHMKTTADVGTLCEVCPQLRQVSCSAPAHMHVVHTACTASLPAWRVGQAPAGRQALSKCFDSPVS